MECNHPFPNNKNLTKVWWRLLFLKLLFCFGCLLPVAFFFILVFFCRILMMYRTEGEDGGHSEFISVTSFRIKNTNILNATESSCLKKASGRTQRGNLWFQVVIRWDALFQGNHCFICISCLNHSNTKYHQFLLEDWKLLFQCYFHFRRSEKSIAWNNSWKTSCFEHSVNLYLTDATNYRRRRKKRRKNIFPMTKKLQLSIKTITRFCYRYYT